MATALSRGFGHSGYALEAYEGERLTGALPLLAVESRLFGRFLVSLPYLNWAGVLAENVASVRALVDEAIALADERGVRYLELRQELAIEHPSLTPLKTEKVQMRAPLPGTEEGAWKMIRSSVRSQIRKGDKQGFRIEFGGDELLDDFYSVFSVNMRDLGTPVYGKRLFSELLSIGPSRAELCVVYQGPLAIACAMLFHINGVTQAPSASALRSHRATAVNTWMYWRMMARAVEKGMSTFDFGRSTMEGPTYDFKRKWGAEPQPAPWCYYVREGNPDEMRPEGGRYSAAIRTWQRLPVWLTRLVGPPIVRGIP
ncbi:FemAB family protein [Pseudobythopirellula maris]|uniref:FemAB family protein n=2 Tax=Pseudobythopirellula maris TaxID=2527991 RepID=A0A5C5ZR40_9BACT|nr:FemAB family protein [Pseudobythopirellula maris]